MRNPKWHRDEIILALELYFRTETGQIHASNPQIIELSEILNFLPIQKERPNTGKFRNPNGVSLKLSNFLALDPTYEGKGMQSYSKLDESVFNEFKDDKSSLIAIATNIRKTVANTDLRNSLYEAHEDQLNIEVKEGKVLFRLHRFKERNSKITALKKSKYLKANGKLDCEACGFEFQKVYGDIGKNFIECHHLIPLNEIEGETKTKLDDLALLCSNCHRMIHKISSNSINELKEIIKRT